MHTTPVTTVPPASAAALSCTAGPTDTPLITATIGDAFDEAVARYPDREALVDVESAVPEADDGHGGTRRWTYAQLGETVDAAARGMLELGISPGNRIGIWAPNCAEWAIVQFAAAKIGAVLVTLNPAYRTAELIHAINQSDVTTVFTQTSFRRSAYAAMLEEARASCPTFTQAVLFDTDSWEEMLTAGRFAPRTALDEIQSALHPDDPINIQYTSGTTGRPKGATLSHRNILNNGFFVGELLEYTEEDRIGVAVPFYHCFGMVMGNLGAMTHGACVVIPAPVFDAGQTLRACAQERVTSLYGVPTMFIALLDHPDFAPTDLTAVRTGTMAGAPCPEQVMRRVMEFAPGIAIAYGMTETSPASAQTRPDDSLDRRVRTIGQAHPHVEVKIIDPVSGDTVPRGVAGEYCVRGYSVMLGYWGQPDQTAETIDDEGWLRSGDLATMDTDGFIRITGRLKDMVIRGGESIFPREIEEVLHTHPHVIDAQVVGVPSRKYGEEVMAWLRVRAGTAEITVEELRAFCADKLAHHKVPAHVRCIDEFPMTVTGKIRKIDLRREAAELLSDTTDSDVGSPTF